MGQRRRRCPLELWAHVWASIPANWGLTHVPFLSENLGAKSQSALGRGGKETPLRELQRRDDRQTTTGRPTSGGR